MYTVKLVIVEEREQTTPKIINEEKYLVTEDLKEAIEIFNKGIAGIDSKLFGTK